MPRVADNIAALYNRVDSDHEFCFGDLARREYQGEGYLRACAVCSSIFAGCSYHKLRCHETQVAYFATSCKYNGTPSAIAGFDITMGNKDNQAWSIPITNRIDRGKRTNNRTDLLAALECVRKMVYAYTHPQRPCEGRPDTWVVATSSDYVVKNYVRHFKDWRARGWQKSSGGEPANLDLWIKLDNMRAKYEDKYGVRIGFYRVKSNDIGPRAASLARKAVDALD